MQHDHIDLDSNSCFDDDKYHKPKFITDDFYECSECGIDFSEAEYKEWVALSK